MADLSDVTAFLAQAAADAVYPNGIAAPSVAGMDVSVFEGWPIPDQLDLDMAGLVAGIPPTPRPGGRVVNVSIYPMQGTGVFVYQILDKTYTVKPPVYGLSVVQAGETITVSGQPNASDYLSLIVDSTHAYSQTGATAAILAALASQAQADYPAAAATETTLTIPGSHSLVVRKGGIATLGKVVHRQRQDVMVTIWAPNRVVRNQVAEAIDIHLKGTNKVTMPDTSQAVVLYNRTNVSDELQSTTIYRRDLIYSVEYATLETFPGYVVTAISLPTTVIASGDATADVTT